MTFLMLSETIASSHRARMRRADEDDERGRRKRKDPEPVQRDFLYLPAVPDEVSLSSEASEDQKKQDRARRLDALNESLRSFHGDGCEQEGYVDGYRD